jgi:putative tryptophan/tyrosine transport system substrate-binding protein
VHAQQPSMPVIGFLHPTSLDTYADRLRPFREGLKDAGFIEGQNVAIEYRWADNQIGRLPALATELVRRQVAVIVADSSPAAFAAKTATTTVPIVFSSPEDPVGLGLVASLARPDGNLTGINWFASELSAKRLELLRELVPAATRVAVLVNPANVRITENTVRDVEAAARAMGLQIRVLNANTSREIDTAFATLASERPDALFVSSSTLFGARRIQLAHWATHHRVPATYPARQYVEAGGLMSYGAMNLLRASANRLSACGRALRPWLWRTLLPAAVLDPSGQASPAERQPCRTAGARFTAARVLGRGRRRA